MNRDIQLLENSRFDVVIVGGGIFGACAAWDATLRGLTVALVEKGDFCSGVSANSFKVVHGGMRYLQHGDLARLRASCHERSALLRIAPHLVQPLPIVVPTYGYGRAGKILLGAGMYLYDFLTIDRNRGIKDPARRIPWTRLLSRREVLQEFPNLPTKGLTGGVLFSDGRMYNPTRLVLAFIQSAVDQGAQVANYVEATKFIRSGNSIEGVEVRDVLNGAVFSIRAKVVLNAAGPWSERLIRNALGVELASKCIYSRDACFIVPRQLGTNKTLAVMSRTHDPDALLSRPARHIFLSPWRNYTLVGVWHVVTERHPENVSVTKEELQSFIDEVNWAYPGTKLSLDDVLLWNAGLVPFGENESESEHLSYGKRSHIIDHQATHGVKGLVTLIGIRYTMGRGDSARAIDLVESHLGRPVRRSSTNSIPLCGGEIDDFEALVSHASEEHCAGMKEDVVRSLVHNHGTEYRRIIEYTQQDNSLSESLDNSNVMRAEVVHATRHEMVSKLSDVVFRRTDLATGGSPGAKSLRSCAELVAKELGWDETRQIQELSEVNNRFPEYMGSRN